MKFIWEPQDIVAGRRMESYNGAEQYLLSYRILQPEGKEGTFSLTSLIDGMTINLDLTHEEMAASLNDGGYRPLAVVHCKDEDDAVKELNRRIERRTAQKAKALPAKIPTEEVPL